MDSMYFLSIYFAEFPGPWLSDLTLVNIFSLDDLI